MNPLLTVLGDAAGGFNHAMTFANAVKEGFILGNRWVNKLGRFRSMLVNDA